eukprot:TRINITY_DN4310_c0_g1_i2.p1 TRINITY_DN4310_c0_g1~~TRINITY_DN4310_c0_g1_i2.p1  ORF type:complete len:239 (-),score=43.56 TRINITY_DN4310_c0_g1_i2:13-729(-)
MCIRDSYRLDAFGWLALSDLQEESPDNGYGNYGLKDQRAAMQWTQRNIQQFGGNPNKVTIFGESAGGWSVCQHMTAPGSNGLFSHAIMESGDCDGPWMILDGLDAKKFGDAFITAAGCDGNGTSASDRTACMRSLPVKDVLQPYISWICFLNKKATDPWCNHSTAMTHSNPLSWPHLLYAPAAENGHWPTPLPVSYTHLRAHETPEHLVCRLLLEKKKKTIDILIERTHIFNTNMTYI